MNEEDLETNISKRIMYKSPGQKYENIYYGNCDICDNMIDINNKIFYNLYCGHILCRMCYEITKNNNCLICGEKIMFSKQYNENLIK